MYKKLEKCLKSIKEKRKDGFQTRKSSHLRIGPRRLCREDQDRKDRKIYRHRRLSGIDCSGA